VSPMAPGRAEGEAGKSRLRLVDWETGLRFLGKLVFDPEGGLHRQVLLLLAEGSGSKGHILLDRMNAGSIGILEASREEMVSLDRAGYSLTID
jgi:hypothetical protein